MPVNHSKNEHVLVLSKVDDDILTNRKAPQANAKIIVAGASQVWMAPQQEKPLGD